MQQQIINFNIKNTWTLTPKQLQSHLLFIETVRTAGWQKQNISYVAGRQFESWTPESICSCCNVFDGNNIIPRPNKIGQNCSRKTQMKIYSVATIADQIMRGRRETERGRVLWSLTSCVFCCVCIRKGLEGSQGSWNALNRMFFMWAYIGTVECWFSISDTCICLHGKTTWLFFQSSIQGFLGGGLFLSK